jgi:citrate synthase
LGPLDQLRCATVLAGAQDPFRSDRRPEAVLSAARRLLTGVSQTFNADSTSTQPDAIAGSIARALGETAPEDALVRVVNTMLVLLADHGFTPSTVAVRLAASARADLYSAIMAGLGVLAGPFYGADSEAATRLLRYARDVGVERALDDELRWRNSLPGFGVSYYPDGDPRFAMIRPQLEEILDPGSRALLSALLHHVDQQRLPPPNMDLALALLTFATDADASFGPAIFGTARIAGWTAHYAEELRESTGRLNTRHLAPQPMLER